MGDRAEVAGHAFFQGFQVAEMRQENIVDTLVDQVLDGAMGDLTGKTVSAFDAGGSFVGDIFAQNGFNTHLVPATSNCYEIGLRGFFRDKLNAEITGFVMKTENDFFRFKQSGRGNQEVFYGNAGNSKRFGIETFISYQIIKGLSLQIAYTYANYKYTSGDVDPVYTDPAYVLTTPPADGQYLPNSPKHQLYSELVYSFKDKLKISFGAEYQSEWAIYTDSKAYNNQLDPAIYQNWQNGFNLFNARVSYLWQIKSFKGEFSLGVRNLSNEKYMAFTEPDPDGNAYQPGPEREFFGNIKISF